MSRYGLAITLAWYQLRAKVTDRLDHVCVVIDVMGLAKVRYGPGYLHWTIKRSTDNLVYFVCIVNLQVNGTFGRCSWNNGWVNTKSVHLIPELRQMTREDYEIW